MVIGTAPGCLQRVAGLSRSCGAGAAATAAAAAPPHAATCSAAAAAVAVAAHQWAGPPDAPSTPKGTHPIVVAQPRRSREHTAPQKQGQETAARRHRPRAQPCAQMSREEGAAEGRCGSLGAPVGAGSAETEAPSGSIWAMARRSRPAPLAQWRLVACCITCAALSAAQPTDQAPCLRPKQARRCPSRQGRRQLVGRRA